MLTSIKKKKEKQAANVKGNEKKEKGEKETPKEEDRETSMVKVKAFSKVILLPVATEVIKEFLVSLGNNYD